MARKYVILLFSVLLLVPVISLGDTTGDHPPEDLVFQETGHYAIAEDTIPNFAPGELLDVFNITGIAAGSSIVKAFLYLNGVEIERTYEGAGGSFNFNTLPWKSTADYVDDFYLGDFRYYCTGYRWDVTAFVTGDGAYEIRLNGPMVCLSAFLVVVYENQALPEVQVSITMGEEILMPQPTGASSGVSLVHIPNIGAGDGRLFLFGESMWAIGEEKLEFNGIGGNVDVFWDHGQAYHAGAVTTLEGMNTVGLTALQDLLLWKIVVLISPAGEAPDPLDKIEAKLDRDLPRLERKLDEGLPAIIVIEGKLDEALPMIERKLDELGGLNVDLLIEDLAKLEAKADKLEAKVDPVGDQLEAIEGKMDRHFGDFSFWELEKKIDQVGGDVTGGLHHLYQIATAAAIDAIEAKLDRLDPNIGGISDGLGELTRMTFTTTTIMNEIVTMTTIMRANQEVILTSTTVIVSTVDQLEEKLDGLGYDTDMIMYDTSFGLTTIHSEIARLEAKLDGENGISGMLYGIEAKLDDGQQGVRWDLAKIENKLDGEIDSYLTGIEAKLDGMHDSMWFDYFQEYVYSQFGVLVGQGYQLEAKIDDGVQPGIETIIGLLGAGGTDATLAMIEAKLDDMIPLVDEIYWDLLPDIRGYVTSNNQLLGAIEAKLDGDAGLVYMINYLESKVDGLGYDMDVIIYSDFGLLAIANGVAMLEAKLDGEGGIVDVLEGIEAKLDADGIGGAISYLESKVDRFEPKIDTIYSYQPDIYGLLQGNSYALGAIEAKLDDGQAGIKWDLYLIEAKLDGDAGLPDIYGGVLANNDALGAIEAKLDGDGGITDSLDGIQGTLDDTIAGGLYQIETKIDGKVSDGIDDIQASIATLDFKIDQVEIKLLHTLLRYEQECLTPMAYTPVEFNPHGKLEEVMWFVKTTIEDLIGMEYLGVDSRAWGEWVAGEEDYNAGLWYQAGYHFWYAYKFAMCDAQPPQQ